MWLVLSQHCRMAAVERAHQVTRAEKGKEAHLAQHNFNRLRVAIEFEPVQLMS